MSTQILYHAFGIADYQHVRFANRGGTLVFTLDQPRHKLRCAACTSPRVHKAGRVHWREVKTLPIGRKSVVLEIPRQPLFCLDCKTTRRDRCPLVEGKRHYTTALERFAVDLCRLMTISDVARFLDLSWDTVKEIEKRYLKRRFEKPSLRGVERIAIDEIAVRKGHAYMTVVLNLDTGRILHVGDGKGADALEPFFRRVRRARVKLKAIAMDMAGGYQAAVKQWSPGTPIVFDRFHIMKLVGEQIDELRRAYIRQCEGAEGKFVKGVRYLLLMNPATLEKHEQRQPGSKERLRKALELNEPLNKAYYLKEKIRSIWDQSTLADGSQVLRECVAEAVDSGVRHLAKLGKTLLRHMEGILAYFEHRITSGKLEGTNNKIKVLKRQAYGYRDDEFFKLKLKGLHESRYAFIG